MGRIESKDKYIIYNKDAEKAIKQAMHMKIPPEKVIILCEENKEEWNKVLTKEEHNINHVFGISPKQLKKFGARFYNDIEDFNMYEIMRILIDKFVNPDIPLNEIIAEHKYTLIRDHRYSPVAEKFRENLHDFSNWVDKNREKLEKVKYGS